MGPNFLTQPNPRIINSFGQTQTMDRLDPCTWVCFS